MYFLEVFIMLQTKNEVLNEIKANLADYNYEGVTFDSFFNDIFNDETRNMYEDEADKEVSQFENDPDMDGYTTKDDGVWGAIDLVNQYEHDLGESSNKKHNSCEIANIIDFIRGESVLNEILYSLDLDDSDSVQDNYENVMNKVNEELGD